MPLEDKIRDSPSFQEVVLRYYQGGLACLKEERE